jgi:hypothetical protein
MNDRRLNRPPGLHRARRRTAGFTLAEVLLTLLIMTGIMVTITQILTAARQDRDTIVNIQERRLAGPAILDSVERDLRAIFTFNRDPRFVLRVKDRVLSGLDADSIDFVCSRNSLIPYREHEGDDFVRADVNEAGYCLRRHPTEDDFLELYRREDFGVDGEPFDGGRYSFLHDQVKSFDVQVYAEDGPEAEPVDYWGIEGEEDYGLPARIEIELTIELSARLVAEQLVNTRRIETYRRVIRFPAALADAQEIQPVPTIPVLEPPTAATPGQPGAGQPPGSSTTTTGGDNPFGGPSGGGGGGGDGGNPFDGLGGGG